MSALIQISGPAPGEDVFSPMVYVFEFSSNTCFFVDVDGSAAIDVANVYAPLVEAGDEVRILNGAYLGVYRIIEIIPGTSPRLVLNTPYIGSTAATGSSRWAPNGAQAFQLIAGYSEGAEASTKPWQAVAEIQVSPNNAGQYRFDVSGFLRSRFSITTPAAGPNVPISLRYTVRLKTETALPTDTGALTAYYGLEALSLPQQGGEEPVGERPILFFGNAPTLYSLALAKGIINNFLANPDAGASTVSGAEIDLRLLSCQPASVNWTGTGPTAGFTTDPALPSWVQATAAGNLIELIINPCSAGVGDYLSADYNPEDYLTGGQINSITGCFSYDFSLGGSPLFTLNICIDPISELITVCPSDVLNFAWINQRGGFSSFAVECKYDNGREFGSDNTVVDATGTLKRVEFRDVYDTTEVRGGVLSKNQLDLLTSLRSSIQAFLFNLETQAFDIPVVIDRSSFRTYGNRFNQAETRFSFRFRRSKQVAIQTQ